MSQGVVGKRGRRRAVWLSLHRWLGLGLGLWFIILGLTGSVLVFYRGLDELIDPRLAARPGAQTLPAMEAVYQALLQAHPQRGPGWRIELPLATGETITARYLKPVETAGQGFAPLLATVDPVSLQVVANRFWGRHLGTWLYDLHYSLLLGEAGLVWVGVSGLLLLVALGSGLWLWWPPRHAWRRALHFKRGASAPRRVYDLHKLAGLAAVPLLGVLALTGAVLALPQWAKPVVAAWSPLTPMPKLVLPAALPQSAHADAVGAVGRLPLDAALQRAEQVFAGAVVRWVDMPASPGAPYRLRLRQPGEPGDRFPDTWLWLDSRSGQVLARHDPARFTAGDSLLRWMHPLHSGQAFAWAGRVVVCLCGLLPLLLGVTGWLRWRGKQRARADYRQGP